MQIARMALGMPVSLPHIEQDTFFFQVMKTMRSLLALFLGIRISE